MSKRPGHASWCDLPDRHDGLCHHPGDADRFSEPDTRPLDDDGSFGVGSLTPGGNVTGPKAMALVGALSQYDDWFGAVLEVIDEAVTLDAARAGREP